MHGHRGRPPWRTPAHLLAVALLTLTGCTTTPPPAGQTVTLHAVSDGDTIRVTLDGHTERVRLLGIDAPEQDHNGRPTECGGPEATAALNDLLEGAALTLIADPHADDRDRYDRLLRVVTADGQDVALALLKQGLVAAYVPRSEPRPERQDDYERAAEDAQRMNAGSWAACGDLTRD